MSGGNGAAAFLITVISYPRLFHSDSQLGTSNPLDSTSTEMNAIGQTQWRGRKFVSKRQETKEGAEQVADTTDNESIPSPIIQPQRSESVDTHVSALFHTMRTNTSSPIISLPSNSSIFHPAIPHQFAFSRYVHLQTSLFEQFSEAKSINIIYHFFVP